MMVVALEIRMQIRPNSLIIVELYVEHSPDYLLDSI